MKKVSLKNTMAQGFSLVEMLVVIAVIGVIAAIAIPQIGGINETANTAKNQRNAQSIVSVYAAANAAGADFTGTDKATIVAEIIADGGVKVKEGVFANKSFGVTLSEGDADAAQNYIDYDAGLGLVYKKEGVTGS